MKKTFLLIALIISITNISCEPEEQIVKSDLQQNDSIKDADINSYENWDAFHKAYSEYAKMDVEALESTSFYSVEKDNMVYSPALQAILNEDNQFKLNNEIIELVDGNFIKKSIAKNGKSTSEKVGSVFATPVSTDNEDLEKSVEINLNRAYWELKEFRQQRYINCQNGVNHGGPSARNFRFLHQAFGEYIITGFQHNYNLWLRLYLEYNHRRGSWRLSGENREIFVNVTDNSFLTNLQNPNRPAYPDFSGNPTTYNLRFSNSCHSHKSFLLRTFNNPGSLGGTPIWQINLNGTIKQKMTGDVESNRWTHNINW
ncbi:hypothetical protein ATO12_14430 [Aquimarina atlantica]|uniref:Uncharacterized protein n=1 Tax=Aquimarina atlantica TaxID=1317122 RepID=A0A023BWS3_9FLAO|nr:hypothetical protein [Aquimarina atlantica]EZH74068.1 hypothetical protein ATO12_14430 [Aquimarina atlantica]